MFKILKNIISSIWSFILKWFFVIVAFLIIWFIGQQFITGNSLTKSTEERYYILFVASGLSATISGLAFMACQSTNDKKRKKTFLYSAQRLLHATILFSVSIVIEYCAILIADGRFSTLESQILGLFVSFIRLFAELWALIYLILAIVTLHFELITGTEKTLE